MLWDVLSDTSSTKATTKGVPAGTSGGGDGLQLHCSPRIEGEAPDIMVICCRSQVELSKEQETLHDTSLV
jgi:hypothetical protein